ncbi:MAG: hypothetical protein LBM96_06785 [Methanobrevibacter sp.]|jgi:adenosine deaminase|nr:hypothetical protein [Candidatus Methanoflexus mossambicus]
MVLIDISNNIFNDIKSIAEKNNTTETEIVTEALVRLIEKNEIKEEISMYKNGIDISIVSEELGMDKTELIKELDEAKKEIDQGKGITLNPNNLGERYGL